MFYVSVCRVLGASLAVSQKVSSNAPVLASQLLPTRGFHAGRGNDPNFDVHRKLGPKKAKHHLEIYKKERGAKVLKVDLIDFHEKTDDLTPQEMRMKMKVRGLLPFRTWDERPVNLACTPSTFESYIPPESDGKMSITSKEGAKQKFELVGKKGRTYLAVRKVQQFDEDFDIKDFAQEAQDIYIKSLRALADEDEDLLHDLITERAYPFMTHETSNKTIRWQFVESIEPPRAVHARYTDIITKENLFAQITIRMHNKQTLAVYDRFGRLMHGSEVVAKDVLEFVVFEKHISSTYGTWRVHDKIVPGWAPRRTPGMRTYRVKQTKPDIPDEPEPQEVPEPSKAQSSSEGDAPRPAVA